MVGVDRFYLYDNESTDCFLPILKPYIEFGKVVLNSMGHFFERR